jgi:hypothetical protein
MYASAFAAMHDAPSVAVLTRDLSDLRWGVYAAGALLEIWSADQPSSARRVFAPWTDFSQHLSRRAGRTAGAPPTSDFADMIFAVVRSFGDAARSDEEQRHALALAVRGLELPHRDRRHDIDALLALPQPVTQKRGLLVAIARAGEVIPAALVMDGLLTLLREAETQTWRLEEDRGELMGWVELFPFSDDPAKVHEALALLPEQHRRPHALHRLLEALPMAVSPVSRGIRTSRRPARGGQKRKSCPTD